MEDDVADKVELEACPILILLMVAFLVYRNIPRLLRAPLMVTVELKVHIPAAAVKDAVKRFALGAYTLRGARCQQACNIKVVIQLEVNSACRVTVACDKDIYGPQMVYGANQEWRIGGASAVGRSRSHRRAYPSAPISSLPPLTVLKKVMV